MLTPEGLAQLQALLVGACRLGDWELARTLSPDIDSQKCSGLPPVLVVSTVPASLIGLAAQRGQTELVNRLVRLSAPMRVNTVNVAIPPVKAVAKSEADHARELQVLLTTMCEEALLTGDHMVVNAMLPDYEKRLLAGHLAPTIECIPALVKLAAARDDGALMGALRKAGAAEWARFKGDHSTLSHVLAEEQLRALASTIPAPAAATAAAVAAATAAAAATAISPVPAAGLLHADLLQARRLSAPTAPQASGAWDHTGALALAARRADSAMVDALMHGRVGAADLRRVACSGDTAMLSLLVGPPTEQESERRAEDSDQTLANLRLQLARLNVSLGQTPTSAPLPPSWCLSRELETASNPSRISASRQYGLGLAGEHTFRLAGLGSGDRPGVDVEWRWRHSAGATQPLRSEQMGPGTLAGWQLDRSQKHKVPDAIARSGGVAAGMSASRDHVAATGVASQRSRRGVRGEVRLPKEGLAKRNLPKAAAFDAPPPRPTSALEGPELWRELLVRSSGPLAESLVSEDERRAAERTRLFAAYHRR